MSKTIQAYNEVCNDIVKIIFNNCLIAQGAINNDRTTSAQRQEALDVLLTIRDESVRAVEYLR